MNNADPSAPPFLQPTIWKNLTDLVHIIEEVSNQLLKIHDQKYLRQE